MRDEPGASWSVHRGSRVSPPIRGRVCNARVRLGDRARGSGRIALLRGGEVPDFDERALDAEIPKGLHVFRIREEDNAGGGVVGNGIQFLRLSSREAAAVYGERFVSERNSDV